MFYATSQILYALSSKPQRLLRKKKYKIDQIKHIVQFKCNQNRYTPKQQKIMHNILRLDEQPYKDIYANPVQYIPLMAECKRPLMAFVKVIQFKIWTIRKQNSKRKYPRYQANFYKNQYYYPKSLKTYMEKELKKHQELLYAPSLEDSDDIFAYYMQLYRKNFPDHTIRINE